MNKSQLCDLELLIGGKLEVLNLPINFDFKQLRMAPEEVITIYKKTWLEESCWISDQESSLQAV